MNQVMTVQNKSGTKDRYGNDNYGASSTVRCRFELVNKIIITTTHDKEPIHGRVFVAPDEAIAIGDKCTFKGVTYKVMTKAEQVGGNGQTNHFELLLQIWGAS